MYVKSWLCFEAVFELMMLVRGAIVHSGSYPVISVWFYQKDTGRMDTFGGGGCLVSQPDRNSPVSKFKVGSRSKYMGYTNQSWEKSEN